jgi:hypothetical protein
MSFFKKLFGGGKDEKKPSGPEPRPEIPADPSLKADPAIRLHHVTHGRHGDHHGGMFGFKRLQDGDAGDVLNVMMAMALTRSSENDDLALLQIPFSEMEATATHQLGLGVLSMGEQMISAFPYLKPSRSMPFTTKDIYRWQNVNNLEADVVGNGKDTFGLGFFATNWAARQEDYYGQQRIEVMLSAVLLVLRNFVPEPAEEGQPAFAPGFCGYFANQDLPGKTYYDFIGLLRSVQAVTIPGGSGYLLELQLINQEDDPDFFVVEAFVNAENVQMEEVPKVGDHVTGALWFQGEVV